MTSWKGEVMPMTMLMSMKTLPLLLTILEHLLPIMMMMMMMDVHF